MSAPAAAPTTTTTTPPATTTPTNPTPVQKALQDLEPVTENIRELLALKTTAFGRQENARSTVVLAGADAALQVLTLAKRAAGGSLEPAEALKQEDFIRDRHALMVKVRGYERRYGGYYGTGF